MKTIRTTIVTYWSNRNWAPWDPLNIKFLLLILGKKFINQNDVEFDLSIGHAPVLFVYLNNKQKMYGGPCTSPSYPPEIHIYRYIFLQNIFTKSQDNFYRYLQKHLKLYEITLFHTSMDFSFYDQPYILDTFARRTAHQSLCGNYLNFSTVPSISRRFKQMQFKEHFLCTLWIRGEYLFTINIS